MQEFGWAFERGLGGRLHLGAASVQELGGAGTFIGFPSGVLGFTEEVAELVYRAVFQGCPGCVPDPWACAVVDLGDAPKVVTRCCLVLSGAQKFCDLAGVALEGFLGRFTDWFESAVVGKLLDVGPLVLLDGFLPVAP
ncbi:hypothetical protein DF17_27540 [Streptomyces rimosus]|nr:hypothetical protein DF17_27540 [Streptomyces rimosus]KUJ32362.1 hypothetical protein ADK46_22720 [Streptomyces rimosus subsp. rimosus]